MAPTNDQPLGLIGLGLLGAALAERLSRAGFRLVGFDVRPEAREGLARLGGRPVGSAALVVAESQRVILSLPDTNAVVAVLAEAALRPGQVILDTTTGDPERMAGLIASLEAKGIAYVDATVLGSSEQAHSGDVIVMAGGSSEVVEAQADVFAAFARRWFHVGPAGAGLRMKLVVNLVLGLNRAVLAEGLAFARQCGLDLPAVLEVLRSGAAYSRVVDAKGAKMLARDFAPQARLRQHLKDVDLILDQARRVGARTPLSEVHQALLRHVVEQGGGDQDNSAVLRAYD